MVLFEAEDISEINCTLRVVGEVRRVKWDKLTGEFSIGGFCSFEDVQALIPYLRDRGTPIYVPQGQGSEKLKEEMQFVKAKEEASTKTQPVPPPVVGGLIPNAPLEAAKPESPKLPEPKKLGAQDEVFRSMDTLKDVIKEIHSRDIKDFDGIKAFIMNLISNNACPVVSAIYDDTDTLDTRIKSALASMKLVNK